MSLQKLTAELYNLFQSGDYLQCQQILAPIKIELIAHDLLVPTLQNTTTTDSINDLKISQRILEIGVLSSLLNNDYQSFENYFGQLRPFLTNSKINPSKNLNTEITKIISLYLIYLLSKGSISKFHIELEYIYNSSNFDVSNDKYLKFPIMLESNLMEGNYIKIWNLLKNDANLPCPEFKHFITTLTNALRFEIAKSIEKTYTKIPISNCKNLLYLEQEISDRQFKEILNENLQTDNWIINDGFIYFNKFENNYGNLNVANGDIIENVLGYAEQIESII
ncbi:unnamed protein product [Candida verbasci]|uniref:PCI domain-containing protein n=1 Tax=Candida verbasci TaxID=1227364 RepID=A0A9W4TWD6_9ASCO|nr:unnamed protein product [Candida verbasci]